MADAKTSKIEEELRRCTEELERCTKTNGSSSLKGLESELFGGLKEQKERSVGVMMGGESRDDTFMSAYAVDGDEPLVLADLSNVHSCLSGGLYKSFPVHDTKIYKKIVHKEHGGTRYSVIAHSTMNKKLEEKVCSISLFDPTGVFVAYVFTTNDPLAFDNFNCYRGGADVLEEPRLQCVEQLVFCNNKVQLSRAYLKSLSDDEVAAAMLPTTRSINLWAKVLGDTHLQGLISTLERSKPKKSKGKYEKPEDEIEAKKKEEEQLQLLKVFYDKLGYSYFRTKYEEYLDETTEYAYNLIPNDFYKQTGQSVILSQKYLDIWNQIAMPCVIGARLRQLKISAHERKLTAAMIPKCVIECSEFDEVWAWKRPKGVSMEDLVDKHFDTLIKKVFEVVDKQQIFINSINAASSASEIANILFNEKNEEKLGLSERFIQALWTGEISLNGGKRGLQEVIRDRLKDHGIGFELYNPVLKRSTFGSYDVAEAIGSVKPPPPKEKKDDF